MNLQEIALIKIIEECSEIQKVCTKALRFGLNNNHSEQPYPITNFQLLDLELKDFKAAIINFEEVTNNKFTDFTEEEKAIRKERINYFNNLSKKLGRLTNE